MKHLFYRRKIARWPQSFLGFILLLSTSTALPHTSEHIPPSQHALLNAKEFQSEYATPLDVSQKGISGLGTHQGRIHSNNKVILTPEEKNFIKNHPEIRLAYDGYYPPYSIETASGIFEGFSVDVIKRVAEQTGLRFHIDARHTWKDLYAAAQQKEIDAVATMVFREDRKEWFTFSDPYIFKSIYVIARPSDTTIQNRQDLAGKKIAMVTGYVQNKMLIESFPTATPIYVNTVLEALESVVIGQADAYVGTLAICEYYINKKGLSNIEAVALYARDIYNESIAVRNDWPELASIINKGLASISEQEMLEMRARWIPSEKVARIHSKENLYLTPQEKEWLIAHPVIRVGMDPAWAPVESMNKDGSYSGISVDYLKHLEDLLGVHFETVPGLSWTEVLAETHKKNIDLMPSIAPTDETQSLYQFTEPYVEMPINIFARSDVSYIGNLKALEGKKVAVVSGYFIEKKLKKDFPYIQLIEVKTIPEGLHLLDQGEVYAFVGNVVTISYYIGNLRYQNLRVAGETPYANNQCMALRNDWPEFAAILQKALHSIPMAERDSIYNRWMSIRYEYSFNYRLLWNLGIGATLALALFLVWNRRLAKEVLQRQNAEKKAIAAQAVAEAANQSKSDFLSNISHEIRTPMNAVLGFSQILKTRITDPKSQHYIESIYSAGTSLLTLINDVLDLSKIEAGKMELTYSPVNIQTLAREVETIFSQKAEEKDLSLQVVVNDNVPDALILDELRIRQILINLVGNALKFTDRGEVQLSFDTNWRPDDAQRHVELIIEVRDTGIGIAPEKVDSIFKGFEQGHKLSVEKGGTGLGLTISKQLVQMMNGDISLDSTIHQGSTFNICLHEVEIANEQAKEQVLLKSHQKIIFDPMTVLIVDDIDYNREIIKTFLDQQPFSIIMATNGKQAIEQARTHRPDIILLDMKMPIMDGYEASRIMKEDPQLQDIPIIAITASALKQDEELILKICEGYLRKPVNANDLMEKMKQFLPYYIDDTILDSRPNLPITDESMLEKEPSKHPLTILLAEDNEINQELALELLKDIGKITVANNGQEAVHLMQQQSFDVVLMDLKMPVMDGLEATRTIREFNKETTILAVSADPWPMIKKECLTAGMNGGLSKPFSEKELVNLLKDFSSLE